MLDQAHFFVFVDSLLIFYLSLYLRILKINILYMNINLHINFCSIKFQINNCMDTVEKYQISYILNIKLYKQSSWLQREFLLPLKLRNRYPGT